MQHTVHTASCFVAADTLDACFPLLCRRYLSRKYSRRGQRVPHPGPGPDTTLLVTDIEDSTALWETLPAVDMDVSLRLHNSCVRTLAAEHNG